MPSPLRAPSPAGAARAPRATSQSYWRVSRAPRYSLLFALPLLAAYEALAALLGRAGGPEVRNGAEVFLTGVISLVAGARASAVVIGIVVLACVALAGRDWRRNRGALRPRVFLVMLAESAALAMVCGLVVGTATARLLHAIGPRMAILAAPTAAPGAAEAGFGLSTRLMLSLGAGLFEELVFRVLLVGAMALALRRVLGARPVTAGAVASVVGALVFSAAHYVGPYGDALTLQSFVFRALAGLFFSALFMLRGFGITAWTHALYDVLVLVA